MALTDRSRYIEGLQHCPRSRYLKYHAGSNGYGIVKGAVAIPLATGTFVHLALQGICELVKAEPGMPLTPTVRRIIKSAVDEYKATVAARGYLNMPSEEVAHTIAEQSALVEALVWGWYRVTLPELVENYDIIAVEQEESFDVEGITQMSRPDLVIRSKATGKLRIRDFKTAGMITDSYIEEYKESVQFAIATWAVEQRLGEPVEIYEMDVLVKGTRRAEYNTGSGEYDGPKSQGSYLIYGYHREANMPLVSSDWQPKWKYKGQDGRGHTLGKAYSKKPIWSAYEGGVEEWIFKMPLHLLQEQFAILGPYKRQEHIIRQYLREMPAEELRWINKLWNLFPIEEEHGWASVEFQSALDKEVPRSYNCWNYGSKCQYYDMCINKGSGWADPLNNGFVSRRPHHLAEQEEMVSRGIELPAKEVEEVEG